jgi:hypothetical protein
LPGETVVISGKYFGTKKGTILLMSDSSGTSSCTPSYWYMDAASGRSMATCKLSTRLAPSQYTVTVSDGTEWGGFTLPVFTVKPRSFSGTVRAPAAENFLEEGE